MRDTGRPMALAITVPIMSPKFPDGMLAISGPPSIVILEYAKNG